MARSDFVLRLAEVNTVLRSEGRKKEKKTRTTTRETLRITCRALRENSAFIFTAREVKMYKLSYRADEEEEEKKTGGGKGTKYDIIEMFVYGPGVKSIQT